MTETTLVLAITAVKDTISRLKGCINDAEKYAADPKTFDKQFWVSHAEDRQKKIAEYTAAYEELKNTPATNDR